MELLLLLAVALLLLSSRDSELSRVGEGILQGMGCAVVLVVGVGALVFGLAYFPNATIVLVCVAVMAFITWLSVRVYRGVFSPEAKLRRAYNRMHKRWYALSWHVVQVERHRDDASYMQWAVPEGELILQRCREEYERYKLLPPQEGSDSYKNQFYPTDIERLEQRLRKASQK